jgi:hypothetical protein
MLNRAFFLRTLVATALGVGLAGCGMLRQWPANEHFDATLDGAQEVPPVATAGTGKAELHFNERTLTLQWTVTYSGLSGPVTGAHIHGPAGPGQNAGIRIPFTGNLNVSPIRGEAKLTPQQANELTAGQWYVNLHTAQHPGGEVRGQLRARR